MGEGRKGGEGVGSRGNEYRLGWSDSVGRCVVGSVRVCRCVREREFGIPLHRMVCVCVCVCVCFCLCVCMCEGGVWCGPLRSLLRVR